MDKVKMIFTWKQQQTASLDFILDNQHQPKSLRIDNKTPGRLVADYETGTAGAHTITWTLGFPDKTFTELSASVSINGGEAQAFPSKNKKEDSLWNSVQTVLV